MGGGGACVVVGGGLLLLVGAGELLEGVGVAELLLVLGALVVGVAVVVTGAAWVVAWVVAAVVAVLCAFFLWCTFFLWCALALALWCVAVVLVVSAARCCLALWLLDEPPHPAIATAAATVITSARFIAPLRSLEDVDSGAAILAQMLRRSLGSARRRLAAITCSMTARRLAAKTGNMTTIWPGLLEGAFAGHG